MKRSKRSYILLFSLILLIIIIAVPVISLHASKAAHTHMNSAYDPKTVKELLYLEHVLPECVGSSLTEQHPSDQYIVGERIASYYCIDGSIQPTIFSSYPIYDRDHNISAIVNIYEQAENTYALQYSVAYSQELSEYLKNNHTERFAIIHDTEGIWLLNDQYELCLLVSKPTFTENHLSDVEYREIINSIELAAPGVTEIVIYPIVAATRAATTGVLSVPGTAQSSHPRCVFSFRQTRSRRPDETLFI